LRDTISFVTHGIGPVSSGSTSVSLGSRHDTRQSRWQKDFRLSALARGEETTANAMRIITIAAARRTHTYLDAFDVDCTTIICTFEQAVWRTDGRATFGFEEKYPSSSVRVAGRPTHGSVELAL